METQLWCIEQQQTSSYSICHNNCNMSLSCSPVYHESDIWCTEFSSRKHINSSVSRQQWNTIHDPFCSTTVYHIKLLYHIAAPQPDSATAVGICPSITLSERASKLERQQIRSEHRFKCLTAFVFNPLWKNFSSEAPKPPCTRATCKYMQINSVCLPTATIMCALKIFCYRSILSNCQQQFVAASLLYIQVNDGSWIAFFLWKMFPFSHIVMHAYCSVSTHSCVLKMSNQ